VLQKGRTLQIKKGEIQKTQRSPVHDPFSHVPPVKRNKDNHPLAKTRTLGKFLLSPSGDASRTQRAKAQEKNLLGPVLTKLAKRAK